MTVAINYEAYLAALKLLKETRNQKLENLKSKPNKEVPSSRDRGSKLRGVIWCVKVPHGG